MELPPDQRREFLERSCGSDRSLLEHVLGLLEMGPEDERLVEDIAEEAREPFAERTVGRYRLEGELGAGGMGTVYVAERADDAFEKRVALKVMSSKLAEPHLVERFRAERQILADLEHPYIARLLDGGELEDGRPYLVMELVEGVPITRYCRERKLGVDERLELFRRVCEAVQHAHRNLVVHRDIKPSNLLVTEDGTPKLLDFGIAKLIEQSQEGELTAAHRRAFTPDYASPEQIEGGPITTATDVYALGVLLYELLTGERPFRTGSSSDRSDSDRASAVEGRVTRPSERLSSDPQTAKRLRGDLDTIVLKALRAEPERRYVSADALAEDLKRHLEGLPVLARPDSFGYRASKFVRRHRAAMVAVVIVFLALAGATVVSVRSAAEARRQAAIAQAVNEFLNRDLLARSSPFEEQNRDLTLREAIDDSESAVAERFEDQPLVEAAIRTTLGLAYDGLGEYEKASSQFDRSFELRRALLGERHPDTLEAMLGQVTQDYNGGRFEEGLRRAQLLAEYSEQSLGNEHPTSAQALNVLALLTGTVRDPLDEIELLERAAEAHRAAFGDDHVDTLAVLNSLAISYDNLGRHDDARRLFGEVLATRLRVLPRLHPGTLVTRISLGTNSMYRGDLEEAARTFEEALADMDRVLGPEHRFTTSTVSLLAQVRARQGDLEGALEMAERVLAVQLRTLPAGNRELDSNRVFVMNLYSRLGRHEEAVDVAEQLLREERRVGGGRVRLALARMANILQQAGRCDRALPLLEEADPDAEIPQVDQDTGILLGTRGFCSLEAGDDVAARQDLERSLDLLEPALGASSSFVQRMAAGLLVIYEREGDEAAAVALRARLGIEA